MRPSLLIQLGVIHTDINDKTAQNRSPVVYQMRNNAVAMFQEEHREVELSYTVPGSCDGIENHNYAPIYNMVSDAVDSGMRPSMSIS